MYEIIYDYDCIVAENMDGYAEYETETFTEQFEGSHMELLDHIKQMRKQGCYNIDATALITEEDYDY